jgi:ATP-dependent protease ClpP protease subunit
MIDRKKILDRMPRAAGSWYSISNKTGTDGPAQIRIYEEIGYWGITEEDFARDLAEITADEIEVQISSPGGDVFAGIAIYNALRAHPARVTTRVD